MMGMVTALLPAAEAEAAEAAEVEAVAAMMMTMTTDPQEEIPMSTMRR